MRFQSKWSTVGLQGGCGSFSRAELQLDMLVYRLRGTQGDCGFSVDLAEGPW